MKNTSYFNLGIGSLLLSLYLSLLGLFIGQSIVYTLAFILMLISPLFMLKDIYRDMREELNSSSLPLFLLFIFILGYILLRTIPLDFSFMMGDASDYYWAGVSSVLNGHNIGRFLPLSDAISAVGFKIFGYSYLPYIHTYISFNAFLLVYIIARKIGLNAFLSFIFIFLLQFTPLAIWFSKTPYSEPSWQVLILIAIYYSLRLVESKNLSLLSLFSFVALIILLPMSRGSGVFFYAIIVFLSLYRFWLYTEKKSSFLIALSLFFLSSSLFYMLIERTSYLMVWQYSRIVYGISIETLTTFFYLFSSVSMVLLFLLHRYWKRYKHINFPLIIVIFSIGFKVAVALFFAFKKELSFLDLSCLNEFGLMQYHFGTALSILIVFGLIYLGYSAIKGEKLALIIIVFYSMFSVPFTMQGVSISDFHPVLLYWHRYYFSEIFIIHALALLYIFRLIYHLPILTSIKKRTVDIYIAILFLAVFLLSIDTKLLKIVSTEGYMRGSSTFYPWLKERTKDKRVTIFYDKHILYAHNGIKELIEKGLRDTRVMIRGYYKLANKGHYKKFIKSPKYTSKDMLLILSATPITEDKEHLELLDKLYLPLTYRYSIEDLKKNKIIHLDLYIYLYQK